MPHKETCHAPAEEAHADAVEASAQRNGVKRDTMLLQSDRPRRVESRIAPMRKAERRHAQPGAGIKRARGVMTKKSR